MSHMCYDAAQCELVYSRRAKDIGSQVCGDHVDIRESL
jgi:hypothetical protein